MKLKIIHLFILSTLIFGQSCVIVKKFAGADIDAEQFDKAREAKIMAIRAVKAKELLKETMGGPVYDKSDISVTISERLINKIAVQYINCTGNIDDNTSYIVKNVNIDLHYGSAIATLGLDAYNAEYDVNVALKMDCLLAFHTAKHDIVMKLEPFNIVPVVETSGILANADDIIENLIKINLGDLSSNFGGIKIPINLTGSFNIDKETIKVRDKVNLDVKSPKRKIDYKFEIDKTLIFKDKIFLSMNIGRVTIQ